MLTLKPSRLRHIWIRWLELTVPYFLGFFTRAIIDFVNSAQTSPFGEMMEQASTHLVVGLIFALLIGLFDVEKYSIMLAEGMIEGPSKKNVNTRISFSISQLDRTRVDDRNIFQKIWGERVLYSIDGEKILLNETVFSPDQRQMLFQRLNYTI
jgi:hypothetical protein